MKTTRIVLRSFPFLLVPALAACGGAAAPMHTGYPEGEAAPWEKASKLNLNDNLEASADGQVSYPDRQRAKWYVVELPVAGALNAKVTFDTRTPGADAAMEILDAGFNVNVEGQNDDDLGQPKKVREYKDARAGKSYIHIFALGRNDKIEYKLRLHLEPKPVTERVARVEAPSADHSAFPWTVPNLPPLAQINPSDDTPTKGGKPPKKPVVTETTPPPPEQPKDVTEEPGIVRAQITEFSDTGGGIKIILNKGTNANIEAGWLGYVVSNKTKKSLPKATFKIRSVKDEESEAVVKVTLDDIQANRNVVLKPSK